MPQPDRRLLFASHDVARTQILHCAQNLKPAPLANAAIARQEGRIIMNYQAYISGQEGHFIVQIECPDDISAAAAAQQLLEGSDGVELWQLKHKIAQFDQQPGSI